MRKTTLAFLLICGACSMNRQADLKTAENAVSADSLLSEIKTLSSDEFEGRKPGSEGEKKTIAYMQQQFQSIGLEPGNPDGTWLQKVPLAGIASKAQPDFSVKGKKLALRPKADYV